MPLASIEGSLSAAPSFPESLDYYTPPTTPQAAPRPPQHHPQERARALLLQEIQTGFRLKKARDQRRDPEVWLDHLVVLIWCQKLELGYGFQGLFIPKVHLISQVAVFTDACSCLVSSVAAHTHLAALDKCRQLFKSYSLTCTVKL